MRHVTLEEWWGGLRSNNYYFVIVGDRLVHISRFAREVNVRRKSGIAEYLVDLDALKGLKVLEVAATNKGILCNASIYEPEELARDPLERRYETIPLSIINNYEIDHLVEEERLFIEGDWRRYYIPMLHRIRVLLEQMRRHTGYIEVTRLLFCQALGGVDIPLPYLIPYSSYARRKSLEGLLKEIHQVWITLEIMNALLASGRLIAYRPSFKQSPYAATATFSCSRGVCSLWYEFDLNPLTMCEGALWRGSEPEWLDWILARARKMYKSRRLERMPLRPDILILEGADTCEDLRKSLEVRALIECKNQEYRYWASNIESQVIPYKELFKPDYTLIASMKEVPDAVKTRASRHGILIIDEVNPKGHGIIELIGRVQSL